MVAALSGKAAGAAWARVASNPDMQFFVDAGSLAKDSRGFISVWTKTRYASPQTAIGIQYPADMTLFVLDCEGARYRIAGGKFLDVHGNVLRQFNEPIGELQPVPVASKIDAVAKDVTAGGDVLRGKYSVAQLSSSGSGLPDLRRSGSRRQDDTYVPPASGQRRVAIGLPPPDNL